MKKKVALYLSGNLRQFKSTYESLNKYLFACNTDVEFDIYMHTFKVVLKSSKHENDEGSIGEAIDLYKPKSVHMETHDEHKRNIIREECNTEELPVQIFGSDYGSAYKNPVDMYNNITAMFYGWKKVNELREDDYDLVIRTRYDLLLFDSLNLGVFLQEKEDVAYVPFGYGKPPTDERYNISVGSFPDFITIGNQDVIDCVCGIYDNLYELMMIQFKHNEKSGEKCTIDPHGSIADVLFEKQFSAKRFYLDHTITRKIYRQQYKKWGGVYTGNLSVEIKPIPKTNQIVKVSPDIDRMVEQPFSQKEWFIDSVYNIEQQ
jgi:hypothetical protein